MLDYACLPAHAELAMISCEAAATMYELLTNLREATRLDKRVKANVSKCAFETSLKQC